MENERQQIELVRHQTNRSITSEGSHATTTRPWQIDQNRRATAWLVTLRPLLTGGVPSTALANPLSQATGPAIGGTGTEQGQGAWDISARSVENPVPVFLGRV